MLVSGCRHVARRCGRLLATLSSSTAREDLIRKMSDDLGADADVSMAYMCKPEDDVSEEPPAPAPGGVPDADMSITFLGTSAGGPSSIRNSSSLVVSTAATSWMFDCGEGTQHRMFRCSAPRMRPSAIDRIFITHMHADHVLGLPGILLYISTSQTVRTTPLHIYGPLGLRAYIRNTLQSVCTNLQIPYYVHEIKVDRANPDKPIRVLNDGRFEVHAAPIRHSIDCFGYVITEVDRAGELDAERLRADGVEPGPIYRLLKGGDSVTLPDGRTINGSDYVNGVIPGRKIVILGDTFNADNLLEKAQGADVVVHEATAPDQDAAQAVRRGHSTPSMAARFARQAKARLLILNHVSPKTTDEGVARLHGDMPYVNLRDQAVRTMKSDNVIVAFDYLRVCVNRRPTVPKVPSADVSRSPPADRPAQSEPQL
ncbi:Metallo-beta-lactamase domain-containing protein [Plasmodiophora brassicae]